MKMMLVLRILWALLLPVTSESLQTTQFTRVTRGIGWEEARTNCLALGADLAVIDRYATEYLLQAFSHATAPVNDDIWIGLHDVALKNSDLGSQGFQWSTCRALSDKSWTNWVQGQPTNVWQSWCIRMMFQQQLKWAVHMCASMSHFLCQKTHGPCTTFKPEAEGCQISTDWLKAATCERITSILSESQCQERCVSYGTEDGSSPLCWAYEFQALLMCTLYVDSRHRVLRWEVRYHRHTHVLNPNQNHFASRPGVNCSDVTVASVAETTTTTAATTTTTKTTSATTESTSVSTTENATPVESTSPVSSSVTSSAVVTSPAVKMTMEETLSASLQKTTVAGTTATPSTTSMPTTKNTSPIGQTSASSSVTSSAVLTSPGMQNAKRKEESSLTSYPTTLSLLNHYRNSTTGTNFCACSCFRPMAVNVSAAKARDPMKRLQKELTVNRSALSSTRRKKESAADDRPSAQATGAAGIIILVLVVCLIVVPDLRSFVRSLSARALKRSQRKEQQNQRWKMRKLEGLDSKA